MAIKFKLESLDGLDEALKSLYAKNDDGEYVLQIDDDPAKAMRKLRSELAEKERLIKEREKAEADAKSAKEREDLERKGEYEKLRAQDQEAIKALQSKADQLESRLRNGARDRAAMEAITAAGGIPKALLPHLVSSLEVVTDGEDYKVVVKADPGKKLTDYVLGLKNEMPWGFNGSGASGGGAPQSARAAPAKKWSEMGLKERTELAIQNPTLAKQLQGAN